ncbi:MAG TPA: 3'-5' exonuclease [Spirochaetota bacterium]|nr:3'-5' exonuclease [Spirochaetota bacterium]
MELNERQKEAVETPNQYNLLLAGAGSGKTKTLTSRIIHLIKNCGINPYNILAVTFTNKAANEMKERVNSQLNLRSSVVIKTFHSFGAYVLRVDGFAVNRDKNFQIYDDKDSDKILLEILKKFDMDKKQLYNVKNWISKYKQSLENYNKMKYKDEKYKSIYHSYNEALEKANCFDFEDLILQPVNIFCKYPEIRDKYRNRFTHILIDEYQDTNFSQYSLIKSLCDEKTNLMVVGDEDQSIYKFRGADIEIILNFQKDFDNSKIIRLEQNYRSTGNILNLANEVIQNNTNRIGKNLFTNDGDGEKVILFDAYNNEEEAQRVIKFIKDLDLAFGETVVLYRTNSQSRVFETLFTTFNIPYQVVGSMAFFDREEIKDIFSILKWILNPKDKLAFERFVNKPVRGIGNVALQKFFEESLKYNQDLFKTILNIENIDFTKKTKNGFLELKKVFENKETLIDEKTIVELIKYFLENLGLEEYYKTIDTKERSDKIDNIRELLTTIKSVEKGRENLLKFLEEYSLSASTLKNEKDEEDNNKVKLMTIHNAKGLEFENVFICGLEDGLFPHGNSIYEEDGIEEERRLFYVAITRAKKRLFISYCNIRNTFYGDYEYQTPSRFLRELKIEYLELQYLSNSGIKRIGLTLKKDKKTNNFDKGDKIKHKKYGNGKILEVISKGEKTLLKIDFYDHGEMEFISEYESKKMEKIDG